MSTRISALEMSKDSSGNYLHSARSLPDNVSMIRKMEVTAYKVRDKQS